MSDILVIGGGIAGLSAAAALASHARVTVLEAEDQIGFHSSGRSATMLHYALGDRLVRTLTLASRPFFDNPPDAFSEVPIGRPMPVLVFAREDERDALDALAWIDGDTPEQIEAFEITHTLVTHTLVASGDTLGSIARHEARRAHG